MPAMYDKSATIPNGQQNSADVLLSPGDSLVGIFMPAAFTGTALTFLIQHPTGSDFTLYSAGSDVSITVAPSKYVALNSDLFKGVSKLKIRSNAAEGADRSLVLAVRPAGA